MKLETPKMVISARAALAAAVSNRAKVETALRGARERLATDNAELTRRRSDLATGETAFAMGESGEPTKARSAMATVRARLETTEAAVTGLEDRLTVEQRAVEIAEKDVATAMTTWRQDIREAELEKYSEAFAAFHEALARVAVVARITNDQQLFTFLRNVHVTKPLGRPDVNILGRMWERPQLQQCPDALGFEAELRGLLGTVEESEVAAA